MVSHLFYSQLALVALVWLFVMLHVAETHRGAPIPPTATPITPKSTRSNEPKPFHGLTHKPHCALCARETRLPKRLRRYHPTRWCRRTGVLVSFVARLHRDSRQRVAAIGRRVHTLCQGEAGLRDQLACSRSITLRGAPCRLTPAPADTATHQRPWLSEGVAAMYTGDGSGSDRSRVIAHRGPVLPGTAVAATASAVTIGPGRGACKGAG